MRCNDPKTRFPKAVSWKELFFALILFALGCNYTIRFDIDVDSEDSEAEAEQDQASTDEDDFDGAPDPEEQEEEPGPGFASWARVLGGPGEDWGYSIEQTADGGYFIAGMTDSCGQGGLDMLALRLDSQGNMLWQRTYGGAGQDRAEWGQETRDGGFVLAGNTDSFGAGLADLWVLKLDADGDIAWQRVYGGEGNDKAHSIRHLADGGFVVAGDTMSFGQGGSDLWILRLDGAGVVLWDKTYGHEQNDYASSIAPTQGGGFVVAGWVGSYSTYLLWLDVHGEWSRQYDVSSSSNRGEVAAVEPTPAGGQITAMNCGSDICVVQLDDRQFQRWSKMYGGQGEDLANAIRLTADDGYVVAGRSNSFEAGNYDGWIMKMGHTGVLQWQKVYGGSGYDSIITIQPTSDGGYVTVGVTDSFGSGGFDILVLKTDDSGNIHGDCPSELVRWSTASMFNSTGSPSWDQFDPGTTSAVVKPTPAQAWEATMLEETLCAP